MKNAGLPRFIMHQSLMKLQVAMSRMYHRRDSASKIHLLDSIDIAYSALGAHTYFFVPSSLTTNLY